MTEKQYETAYDYFNKNPEIYESFSKCENEDAIQALYFQLFEDLEDEDLQNHIDSIGHLSDKEILQVIEDLPPLYYCSTEFEDGFDFSYMHVPITETSPTWISDYLWQLLEESSCECSEDEGDDPRIDSWKQKYKFLRP